MTNDTEGVWDDDWDEMDHAGRNSIGGY